MSGVADLSPLAQSLDRVVNGLRQGNSVWVIGAVGTGRSTLARQLIAKLNAHMVDLPPLGPDAAQHGLGQLASGLSEPEDRKLAYSGNETLNYRVAQIGRLLVRQSRPVVVLVPNSWSIDKGDEPHNQDRVFLTEARNFLNALVSVPQLQLVLLTERLYAHWRAWNPLHVRLEDVRVDWNAFTTEALWNDLAEVAAKVRAALEARFPRVSPITARLAVGCLATGMDLSRIEAELGLPDPIRRLARALVGQLHEQDSNLWKAALRLARSRYPLPITFIEEECQNPLLTQSLGYGDHKIKMTTAVREALLESDRVPADPDTHHELASYYKTLDGAPRVEEAGPGAALAWLERVHHLAHSGDRGESEWRSLIEPLALKDFLIDRARSLSRDLKQYDQAAKLYQRAVDLDPDNDYAWHYLAFNRDMAGYKTAEVEPAYRKAIVLAPRTPWWNGRYINHLISRARFAAARECWAELAPRVSGDPQGRTDDPELAVNFHSWIVEQWLAHGRPIEAMKVMQAIAPGAVAVNPILKRLRQRCYDAYEVQVLEEAVYPPSFPYEARWERPPECPEEWEGKRLQSWHPARVLEASSHSVCVVYATTEKELQDRRVLTREISGDDWETAAQEPALFASGFYFIAAYTEQALRITRIPSQDAPRLPQVGTHWEPWI